jgi:hypothetical protein
MKQNTLLQMTVAIGELCEGAFFFAMQSCEYSTVIGIRKTAVVRICDIRFFHGTRELDKTGTHSKFILAAQTVTIIFVSTKSGDNNIDITHHRSNKDLCPVTAWGTIVLIVLKYPGTTLSSQVNTVLSGGKIKHITSTEILLHIRATVDTIGKRSLGFVSSDVGTHSIRSSCDMQMYLQGAMVYTIMLQGRWCSDTFLLYICRQVQQFSTGLSTGMVKYESFFTIPDNKIHTRDDPRTRNRNSFALSLPLNGSGPNGRSSSAIQPSVSLWS